MAQLQRNQSIDFNNLAQQLLTGVFTLIYIFAKYLKHVRENRFLRQQIARYTTSGAPDSDKGAVYVKQQYGGQRPNLTSLKTLEESGIEVVTQGSQSVDGLIIGSIESIEVGVVKGWACQKGNLSHKLQIALFIDNHYIASINRTEEANQQAQDICLTTFQGKFLPSIKQVQKDYKSKIGFSYVLPDFGEAEHQIRVLAVQEGSLNVNGSVNMQGFELINSPAAYVETNTVQSTKYVSDRKDRLLVKRNAQIVALNDQLRNKQWDTFADASQQLNKTRQSSQNTEQYMAVIGLFAKTKHEREILRNNWFPSTGPFRKNLEDKRKLIIRFLSPKGSVDDNELNEHNDIIRLNIPENVDPKSDSLITKAYFSQIYYSYNALFYFKMERNTVLNIPELLNHLEKIKGKDNLYIGCFKSGQIYTESDHKYYEKEHSRFGSSHNTQPMQYIKHATNNFYGMSRGVVEYITLSSPVLHTYTFEDVTVGSWMIGLEIEYHTGFFCCETYQCRKKHQCIAIKEQLQSSSFASVYKQCITDNKYYKSKLNAIAQDKWSVG